MKGWRTIRVSGEGEEELSTAVAAACAAAAADDDDDLGLRARERSSARQILGFRGELGFRERMQSALLQVRV
jgi:hypothetical protein